jgi:hypothetical protein
MNRNQEALFSKIKEAISNSIEYSLVRKNAIKVTTPYLDWMGAPVSLYITEEGHITDGGQTLNQICSLRANEDFEFWPYKIDYFERYNIQQIRGNLDLCYLDSPEGILKYVQGISRLPTFFEAKPISDTEDKFPQTVRRAILDTLINDYPERPRDDPIGWALNLTKPRSIKLDGITIHSDMSPSNKNRLMQIISHANSSTSDKRQHIASKLLDPLLWRRVNPQVEMFAVVYDLSKYPNESQSLLKQEADGIFEMKNEPAKIRVAEAVADA